MTHKKIKQTKSDSGAHSVASTEDSIQSALPPGSSGSMDSAPETQENFFDAIDWRVFWITFLISCIAYLWTIAPNLTLEDSGELAVASYYAGVPHPPGYPIWTIYSWLFTKLVPFSNVAFRVALSSAFAGVFCSAMLALIVSRGSRRLIRGLSFISDLPNNQENWIRLMSGIVAGLMLTFNSVMWSQSVIVEVYSFSVCFFVASLLFLFRWTHSPEKNRYLYWCFLMFGVAVTNHQTLICAAMGIEVVILFTRPSLGRNFLAANSLVFIFIVLARAINNDLFASLQNGVLNFIFWIIGLTSLGISIFLYLRRSEKLLATLHSFPVVIYCGILFLLTHLTYFFMPVTSMTNPPMNWGYPRTEEGFWHAVTRGQYERINPTDQIFKFVDQSLMFARGVAEEYSIPLALLALLPFLVLHRMRERERGWWIGMGITFIGVSFLLLILLNPNTDAQSKAQTRVFFIPAHAIISMALGASLTIVSCLLLQAKRSFQNLVSVGSYVFLCAAFANFALVIYQLNYFLPLAGFFLLLLASIGFILLLRFIQWDSRSTRAESDPAFVRTGLIAISISMPLFSAVAHWSDSEQRNHLFGFWFGHDMFSPPFDIYPEMDQGAILFGGTDPGRFCPTYMIFCESFIPTSKKVDPDFDRRDVYLITQNALADGTYLDYLRAHYNRSRQTDPYFFQELFRSEQESTKNLKTNFIARSFIPVDKFFTRKGQIVETRRRANGVYPPNEIYIPTERDLAAAFYSFQAEVRTRLEAEGKGGVDPFADGLITGTESVMAINAKLARLIFENNPDREFFLEESFALDWMYPHLSPFGIIFKLNREPLSHITDEMIQMDKKFWIQYSNRLIGDWISEDTTIDQICDFAVAFLSLRNVAGYPVDPKFFRDSQAQKSFSKLRGSQAELFAWRYRNSSDPIEQEKMLDAALLAFKQAFCFYPGSPEAVYRLANLLAQAGRIDDAVKITQTAVIVDPHNPNFEQLFLYFKAQRDGLMPPSPALTKNNIQEFLNQKPQFEQQFQENPLDITNNVNLIDLYWTEGNTNAAFQVIDSVVTHPNVDKRTLTVLAEKVAKVPDLTRLEGILSIMTQKFPDNPEALYDLASLQAFNGKHDLAIDTLSACLQLNRNRLAVNPNAKDLRTTLAQDQRFQSTQSHPAYSEKIKPFLN